MVKMKRILSVTLVLLTVLVLSACKQNETDEIIENPYKLPSGLTPTEMIDKVDDFILNIYAPFSQKSIDEGIEDFAAVATELEIEELKNTVGEFDSDKRASVSKLDTSLCTPDNSSTRTYKIVSTFTIELNGVKQNMLIEFTCNQSGLIDTHSIWVNNDNN